MRRKPITIAGIALVLICVVAWKLFVIFEDTIRIDTDNIDAAKAAVQDSFGVISDDIVIRDIKTEKDMVFVLYGINRGTSGDVRLRIFEKVLPIGNIYKKLGGAQSSKEIDTASFFGDFPEISGMLIVYGDNSKPCASSYTLDRPDGTSYRKDITENLIFDIYFFEEERELLGGTLRLYDANGQEL